jgi:hypothetical protein
MIDHDRVVGALLDRLDALGIAQDTVAKLEASLTSGR